MDLSKIFVSISDRHCIKSDTIENNYWLFVKLSELRELIKLRFIILPLYLPPKGEINGFNLIITGHSISNMTPVI